MDKEQVILVALLNDLMAEELPEVYYWDVHKKDVDSNIGKGKGKIKQYRSNRLRHDVTVSIFIQYIRLVSLRLNILTFYIYRMVYAVKILEV